MVVLTLAFGGLLYSTLREGTEYYKHVDEVMADPGAWHGKKLQLHGYVVDKSILQKPDTLDYRFQVQSNGEVVQASYTGDRPRHVQGRRRSRAQGHVWAGSGFAVDPNGVMAKCPSKYEPGKAGAPGS